MMRTLRAGLASCAVSALLLGSSAVWGAEFGGVGQGEAPVPRPFAPPPAPVFEDRQPLPLIDVTGSISEPAAVGDTPASIEDLSNVLKGSTSPKPDDTTKAPVVAVPVPDLPAHPVINPVATGEAAGTLALTSDDLAQALTAFLAPDQMTRANESAAQSRQRHKDREAIAAFYASHNNAPIWLEGDHFSAAARSTLARIDRAGEDGLNLVSYALPSLSTPDRTKLAAAELALSEAVVAYARQASGGRIDPLSINRLITAKPAVAEASEILTTVPAASDPGAALRNYNPPQPGYAALRAKLAELRQQAVPMARETIQSGPTLKLGMRDARVPLIRSRFGLDMPSASVDPDDLVYDTKVAAAVAEFQRTNGLPPSGILTPKTIAAMSGGNPSRLENELIANMERWRWLPRDLGSDHISVNIPDYGLEVVKGDQVVHRARVVVGKPDHQTPVFSDAMRFIIVNPYWNVPLSIIKKEMLPKLAADPNYFANHGYEVVERNGTTYVRQPPGEDNALGRIKFMFPNQHSVYLHDTNARALFGKDKRAFSHGCVRVDQPFRLAEVVLGPQSGWTEKRIQKLIGGGERTINLPAPLPIHITYFTTFVDPAGGLQLRDDLYGYSAKVKLALGLRD